MDKLLPCPFCGKDMIAPYVSDLNVWRHPYDENCFAGRAIIHPENRTKWNTRHTQIEHKGAIE